MSANDEQGGLPPDLWTFPEVEGTEAEWEAQWDASIAKAREYGWPEDAIQTVLLSNRVSFAERLESISRVRRLLAEGNWREAFWEAKRTRLREPGPPEWAEEMRRKD